jgi:hypothetical protein
LAQAAVSVIAADALEFVFDDVPWKPYPRPSGQDPAYTPNADNSAKPKVSALEAMSDPMNDDAMDRLILALERLLVTLRAEGKVPLEGSPDLEKWRKAGAPVYSAWVKAGRPASGEGLGQR